MKVFQEDINQMSVNITIKTFTKFFIAGGEDDVVAHYNKTLPLVVPIRVPRALLPNCCRVFDPE